MPLACQAEKEEEKEKEKRNRRDGLETERVLILFSSVLFCFCAAFHVGYRSLSSGSGGLPPTVASPPPPPCSFILMLSCLVPVTWSGFGFGGQGWLVSTPSRQARFLHL